jgi:hypothetical protein
MKKGRAKSKKLGKTKRVSLKDAYSELSEDEKDRLYGLAFKHHFEIERDESWIPEVKRSVLLLEGVNMLTQRPCRIYVSPNKRLRIVETL